MPRHPSLSLLAGAVALAAALAGTMAATTGVTSARAADHAWTADERETLGALRLAALPPLPHDPSNRVADDPRAVALGHRLFFDARLSGNGRVSCATCHDPSLDYQDGRPLARGVGTTDRRTMPIASTAWSEWMFWDGRKDSQWSQALGPLESAVEHGTTRAQVARLVATEYRAEYEALFGRVPDVRRLPAQAGPAGDSAARQAWQQLDSASRDAVTRTFVNAGKAIAAYERTLRHAPSRFDRYADAVVATGHAPSGVLTNDEEAGLRIFIGRGSCTNCHNGPLFTDQHFHNTGVAAVPSLPEDRGRARGAALVQHDEFNCRSRWSDARPEQCEALEFMVADGEELDRAFKTPSLRNVAIRAPYMHAGQLADLATVLRHYNSAPKAPHGHSELRPLQLTGKQRRQLAAFLGALTSPLATPRALLEPPR